MHLRKENANGMLDVPFLSLHDFCTKCLISNGAVFDTLVLH